VSGTSPARGLAAAGALLLALAGCASSRVETGHLAPPPGSRYVAMGSSFAAGPGVGEPAETPKTRCDRSADNYARLLARALRLTLTDVSCGGATTTHVLGGWDELPAQIDAVTADTRLVTVTIGGNDVGYVGRLIAASCKARGNAPLGGPGGRPCFVLAPATEQAWAELDRNLRRIVAEVRRRAPGARLVFVDYLTLLPERGRCAATPLSDEDAEALRAVAERLAALTADAAQQGGADILRASSLSRGHDPCAAAPWTTGFPSADQSWSFPPYHPNAAGMRAVADALRRHFYD
jgi:lysophospholipase L1-like esterase